MKRIIILLIEISFCAILFSSCEKSNDDYANYFKVGDTEYPLTQGILVNFGIDGPDGTDSISYEYGIILFSSGFTISEDDIVGSGQEMTFYVYSSDSVNLPIGDYSFYMEEQERSGTFAYADYGINYNFDTGEDTEVELVTGTLTISQNSDTYEISFNDDNDNVSLYYKGSLTFYDYSELYDEDEKVKSLKVKAKIKFK